MSYLVLARKYRPHSFAEMVGQEHVVQALGNALTQQRLHHAYLFTGTRGVGKTTVSRILAKSLNCTGADGQGTITATPCGVCAACTDIDAGRFVDYVELDAASNRGVEEITQLLDQSVYKPVMGRFKVYMIDEVHMLSTTAFNAMLKTLEEPPDYLKFVLATTDPQKVPVTVLSRCLQFNLRPMAPVTVFEHLNTVLGAENIPAEAGALHLIARAARGSMRDGLSLTDQAIAFGAGTISEAGVRQMLGAVDRSHVLRIVEAVAASDGKALVAASDALRAEGLSAAGALEELATVAQQMAVLQAVPDALDPEDPDAAAIAAVAGLLPADETQLMYSLALHGRTELGLAPDEYAGLTMVLLRLLTFRPGAPGPKSASLMAAGAGAGSPARTTVPRDAAAGKPSVAMSGAAATPVAPAVRKDLLRATPPAMSVPAPPLAVSPAPRAAFANPAPPAAPEEAVISAPAAALVAAPAPVPVPARLAPQSTPAVRRVADDVPPWEDIPPVDLDELSAPAPSASAPSAASAPSSASAPSLSAPFPSPRLEVRDDPAVQNTLSTRPSVAAPPAVAEPPAHEADPGNDGWIALVRQLLSAGAVQALTRELAVQSQCIRHETAAHDGAATRWTLRVERESLRQPGHIDKLARAIQDLTGQAVQIELEAGPVADNLARRDAHAKAAAQSQAEHAFRSDERVLSLLARYPTARIVDGSVRPA